MKPYKRVVVLVLLVVAMGLVTAAGYAYSLKWSQPPVLGSDIQAECFYGWDEASVYQQGPVIAADDWRCQGRQPVSDIHWWGSYKGWTGQKPPSDAPVAFHIGIWTDVPAGGEQNFSHPGKLVREWRVERAKVNEALAGCDYHPVYANPPEACFKYDFQIPQTEWFYQEGEDTIYWLSIAAIYNGMIEPHYVWGWTTRPHYFNDAAIKIFDPLTPTVGSEYKNGTPIADAAGAASWDLAFELTTPDYDYGDAPERSIAAGYPTRLVNNGARHLISPNLRLGAHVDAELDGQPTGNADGDDFNPLSGPDDEDGVVFTSLLMPGQPATLDVTASAPGYLNAWIDYNMDWDWLDAGEQIFSDTPLAAGVNHLSIVVPPNVARNTTARFRFSSVTGLSPAGEAPDGEVEDYRLEFVNWGKWVDDELWGPNLVVTAETSDTIKIVDVVTYPVPFHLTESWTVGQLALTDWTLDPPEGSGTVDFHPEDGNLEWTVPFTPTQIMTLTKWFHVEPCTWEGTVLIENLEPLGPGIPDIREVNIAKLQPKLDIASIYEPEVYAGWPAAFTLVYSNSGGYENDVVITNTFPIEAPFKESQPPPTAQDPAGAWARWEVGDLANGAVGSIDVTVAVASGLQPSTTFEIPDSIYNHVGRLADEVLSTFHVRQPWTKLVNGEPWSGDVAYTVQTSDTITIVDVVAYPESFQLIETWTQGELELIDWTLDPPEGSGTVLLAPGGGRVEWTVSFVPTQVLTLTKVFHVEPCTWERTVLEERLGPLGTGQQQVRQVHISKLPPQLGIDSLYSPPVRPGQLAVFTLVYSNAGGFENNVWITNTFPSAAPFVESQPPPTGQDPAGLWATWHAGDMPTGAQGSIAVTVAITTAPVSAPAISVWDGIYNHIGQVMDEVTTTFYLSPWAKWIDGQLWRPDFVVTTQTSETVTIVDSFDPSAGDVTLTESWDVDKLKLIEWKLEGENPGTVISDAGYLRWDVVPQEIVTLTKVFHVEPCTWTEAVIREVWGPPQAQPKEIREVIINKLAPELHIDAQYPRHVRAGRPADFTLVYSNTGGYENSATITNTFPRTALFASSVPLPSAQDPNGGWARWDLGDLATNESGSIAVTVNIHAGLKTSTTLQVWDGIYNHAGGLADEVFIPLHVRNFFISVVHGNWHDLATWGATGTPTTTSDVTITAGTVVSVAGPASCNKLFIESGAELRILHPFSLTVEEEVINNGWLSMGKMNSSPIARSAAAVLQEPTTFFLQNADGSQVTYYGLVITPTSGSMDLITVMIKGDQTCTGLPGAVQRCYEITPQNPIPATVAFYYRSVEAGGNTAPIAWHWDAGESRWEALTSAYGGSGDAMWVQATGVTEYSPFALDDGIPTAVTLESLATTQTALVLVLLASMVGLILVCLAIRWRVWRAG